MSWRKGKKDDVTKSNRYKGDEEEEGNWEKSRGVGEGKFES